MSVVHYADLDQNGVILAVGFAAEALAEVVLARPNRYSLTLEQAVMIAAGGRWCITLGELAPYVPAFDLAYAQLQATRAIDQEAENARRRFLTPGPGQAMEYLATQSDAQRFIAESGIPDPLNYSWLVAEQAALAGVGVEVSLAQVAATTNAQAAAWALVGAEIKRIRRTAKLAIQAASTQDGIDAALAVSWPSPD